MKNSKGFTLIEIIAVFIILGILMAVAIPKFLSLQEEAKKKNAMAAVAAGESAISLGYAKYLMDPAFTSADTPASPAAACQEVSLEAPAGVTYSVACTGENWGITTSEVKGIYDDQSSTGTWTKP